MKIHIAIFLLCLFGASTSAMAQSVNIFPEKYCSDDDIQFSSLELGLFVRAKAFQCQNNAGLEEAVISTFEWPSSDSLSVHEDISRLSSLFPIGKSNASFRAVTASSSTFCTIMGSGFQEEEYLFCITNERIPTLELGEN